MQRLLLVLPFHLWNHSDHLRPTLKMPHDKARPKPKVLKRDNPHWMPRANKKMTSGVLPKRILKVINWQSKRHHRTVNADLRLVVVAVFCIVLVEWIAWNVRAWRWSGLHFLLVLLGKGPSHYYSSLQNLHFQAYCSILFFCVFCQVCSQWWIE